MLEINGGHIYLGKAKPAGGGTITVDDALSLSSENPVQNKVITAALNDKQDKLDGTVYTTDNLIAGTNISITQVPAPVIDENTLALWNFESGVNDVIHNIAANANYGDGTPSQSATKKFGEYGGEGSARLVYNLSSVLPAGTTKLTLDWWESSTSGSLADVFLCNYTNINNRPTIIGMDASKYFYVNDQSEQITTESPTANTWTHRCLTVDASTGVAKYFQNGVLKATKTVPTFTIGATNFSLLLNSPYGKVYDEIRVSDVIRWDSNFTPFDEPYTQGGDRVYQINNTQESGKPVYVASLPLVGEEGLLYMVNSGTTRDGYAIFQMFSYHNNDWVAVGAYDVGIDPTGIVYEQSFDASTGVWTVTVN